MKFASIYLACGIVGLAGPVLAAGDRFNVSPAEHAACDGDASMLCGSVQDEDQLLGCMKSHRADLTPRCASVFAAGLKRRGL